MKSPLSSSINLLRLTILLGVMILGLSSSVTAQDPASNGNNGGGAVVVSSSNKYVKEGIIFAILAGAAIYSVCRSSPRGL